MSLLVECIYSKPLIELLQQRLGWIHVSGTCWPNCIQKWIFINIHTHVCAAPLARVSDLFSAHAVSRARLRRLAWSQVGDAADRDWTVASKRIECPQRGLVQSAHRQHNERDCQAYSDVRPSWNHRNGNRYCGLWSWPLCLCCCRLLLTAVQRTFDVFFTVCAGVILNANLFMDKTRCRWNGEGEQDEREEHYQ